MYRKSLCHVVTIFSSEFHGSHVFDVEYDVMSCGLVDVCSMAEECFPFVIRLDEDHEGSVSL